MYPPDVRRPGFEPGPPAWEAGILTSRRTALAAGEDLGIILKGGVTPFLVVISRAQITFVLFSGRGTISMVPANQTLVPANQTLVPPNQTLVPANQTLSFDKPTREIDLSKEVKATNAQWGRSIINRSRPGPCHDSGVVTHLQF